MSGPVSEGDELSPAEFFAEAADILQGAHRALERLELPDHAQPYEALQRITVQLQQGTAAMLSALTASSLENGQHLARLVELAEAADQRKRRGKARKVRPGETPNLTSDELLTALQRVPNMSPDAGIFIDVRDGKLNITQTLDFDVPIAVNGEWLPGTSRHRYTVAVAPG